MTALLTRRANVRRLRLRRLDYWKRVVAHGGWLAARDLALAGLVQRPALVVVLGEAGTGKTFLLNELARVLRVGGIAVDLVQDGADLVATAVPEGNAVLLVDDAGRADPTVLSAMVQAPGRLMVLADRPEFADRLGPSAASPVFLTMAPLASQDVAGFLAASLAPAERLEHLFDGAAIARLAERSGGVPGLLHGLAATALFLADREQVVPVETRHVDQAALVSENGLTATILTLQPQQQPQPSQAVPSQAVPSQAVPSQAVPPQAVRSQPVRSQPVPSQPVPSQPVPSQPVPSQAVPSQAVPSQAVPSQPVPSQAVPSQAVPSQPVPSQAVPSQAVPSQAVPSQAVPSQPVPSQPVPSQPVPPAAPAARPLSPPPASSAAQPRARSSDGHRTIWPVVVVAVLGTFGAAAGLRLWSGRAQVVMASRQAGGPVGISMPTRPAELVRPAIRPAPASPPRPLPTLVSAIPAIAASVPKAPQPQPQFKPALPTLVVASKPETGPPPAAAPKLLEPSLPSVASTTVTIVYPAGDSRAAEWADSLAGGLRRAGFAAVELAPGAVRPPFGTRYVFTEDRDAAAQVAAVAHRQVAELPLIAVRQDLDRRAPAPRPGAVQIIVSGTGDPS